MSLCINTNCPRPNHPDNNENRFCQSCGYQLELLGRYRVMRLLSDKTGFGKVYEAYEQDKPKILKVLKEDLNSDAKAVQLFQQEAAVLGQMNHPGIPKVDSYFQHHLKNGLVLHCIVMEKIEGPNLEQWLMQQQYRPISQEHAIAWLRQLAEILHLVHSKHYLHRDIKPSNIMIRPDGQLVLIDFGSAKEVTTTYLTKLHGGSGSVTGIMSSGYSAPEQMNGQARPQSDFFALGRTFVFLLTGHHPLDMYDVYQNVLHWWNCATHVSALLLNFIDWLMAQELGKRPANTQEILQRLAEIERQLSGTTAIGNVLGPKHEHLPAPTTITSLAPENQPKKVSLLALGAVFLMVLGLLGVVALVTQQPKLPTLTQVLEKKGPERKGKVDYFPYQPGKDSQGRTAEFNIAVLSVEHKWLVNSDFQVKSNNEIINLDALRLNLEEEGIETIMENPNEIISVGTASCEGAVKLEEHRAFERSKQIQLLAKKLFRNTPSVEGYRLLNLGQFRRSDCQYNKNLTAYQRSIIIIGIRKKSEGVILDEALRNRLDKTPFADFNLKDYSLGSPQKFKTIPSNL